MSEVPLPETPSGWLDAASRNVYPVHMLSRPATHSLTGGSVMTGTDGGYFELRFDLDTGGYVIVRTYDRPEGDAHELVGEEGRRRELMELLIHQVVVLNRQAELPTTFQLDPIEEVVEVNGVATVFRGVTAGSTGPRILSAVVSPRAAISLIVAATGDGLGLELLPAT